MHTTFIIAAHHLRRIVRNPGLVLLMLAIPVTLAVIEYGAFGRIMAQGKLPPAKVLFLDDDDTLLSSAVPQAFASGPVKDFFELAQVPDLGEARRMFQRNEAAALVLVPKGFQDALLAGRRAELVFYKNPIQTIGPEIVRSALDMTMVIGNGMYAQAAAPILKVRTIIQEGRAATPDEAAEISRGFYEAGIRLGSLQGLSNLNVAVQRPGASPSTAFVTANPRQFFAYIFPGLAIFALMFIAQGFALRLMRDRLRGLQRRIAMTPASPTAVVAGGVVYLVTGLFALLLVLALIGTLIFRIQLQNPVSLLVLGTGTAVFAAGLHLLSIGLARSDRSASFVGSVVVLVLALFGGTFLPAEQLPSFLQSVAVLTPNGAAQQGFVDVLVRGKGLADIGARAGVVWSWGMVMMLSALWVERRRMRT